MRKQTEAARRAAEGKNRVKETKADIAARFLSRTPQGALLATFPNHFGTISKGPIDISHLDRHPGLRDAFAFGYVMHCFGVESADRRYYVDQQVKSGFLAFLADRFPLTQVGIGEIDEAMLKAFKKWLDDPESNGFCASELTRKIKIQDVQLILRQLMADDSWSKSLSPDLRLLEDLYRRSHRKIQHTEILDDATLELLFVSAAADCERTIRDVEARDAAFAELLAAGGVADPTEITGDAMRCAAFLLHEFGDRPPTWEEITRKVAWARAMDEATFRSAADVLFPDLAELLPFVLLLSTLFAFNPA